MTILEPEYHRHEEFINRSQKLEEIKQLGIDPYPPKFSPTATPGQIVREYEGKEIGHSEDAQAGTTPLISVAGRLILFRAMGKNAFAHIQDESGRVQIMFNRDHTQVAGFQPTAELSPIKFIEKKIDLGDILGIEGNIFRTQKGEVTIFAKTVTVLCKSLLPLPDKHSGLADKGVRYRKRWLDLIAHPDVMQTFDMRSRILKTHPGVFLTAWDLWKWRRPCFKTSMEAPRHGPLRQSSTLLTKRCFFAFL